jgi:hypothetical protein
MMPKTWRIKMFNWLGAGKITLNNDKQPDHYNMAHTPTNGGFAINPNGNMPYNTTPAPTTGQTFTIRITPANGGTIVQMNAQDYSVGELYVIPDGTDFDRELGKIITMNKLKA